MFLAVVSLAPNILSTDLVVNVLHIKLFTQSNVPSFVLRQTVNLTQSEDTCYSIVFQRVPLVVE